MAANEMTQRMQKNPATTWPVSRRDLFGLLAFLFVCLLVSAVGGLVTASSVGGWYATLDKPVFNPPNWVFAPVWTVLYVLMAVAAWRVWRGPQSAPRSWGLIMFAVQLALNLLWSVLFFGLQLVGVAVIEILLLLAAIVINALLFHRVDRLAGWLFAPYVLWVAFATSLNLALWWLN